MNMRPVRLAPCAAGARPTIATRAAGSPKPDERLRPVVLAAVAPRRVGGARPRATRPAAGSGGRRGPRAASAASASPLPLLIGFAASSMAPNRITRGGGRAARLRSCAALGVAGRSAARPAAAAAAVGEHDDRRPRQGRRRRDPQRRARPRAGRGRAPTSARCRCCTAPPSPAPAIPRPGTGTRRRDRQSAARPRRKGRAGGGRDRKRGPEDAGRRARLPLRSRKRLRSPTTCGRSPTSPPPGRASLLGSIAANQAQHLVLLRRALGADAAESIPEAFEDGTTPAAVEG